MKTLIVEKKVNQPDIEDYEKAYPSFPCETDIFKIIIDIDNISRALTVVEELCCSPVAIYESKIQKAINDKKFPELSWYQKQFVGRAVCVVMESNGWEKTGKKQRFTKGIFKSAELYKKR